MSEALDDLKILTRTFAPTISRREVDGLIERLSADFEAKDRRVLELTEALSDLLDRAEEWCAWDLHRCHPELWPTIEKAQEYAKHDAVIGQARNALVVTDAPPSCGETVRPSSPESEETKDE